MNLGIIIAIGIIVLLVLYFIVTFNVLITLRNKVKTNWSQVSVVLKRRADLIPNLVEVVKGYASHEKTTLEAVISARNKFVNSSTPKQEISSAGELNQALSRLMMLGESYPKLKANDNFIELQQSLEESEDKVSYARQIYNDSVYKYQNKIEMFPSNIVAKIGGFNPFAFFEITDDDKQVPKVSV